MRYDKQTLIDAYKAELVEAEGDAERTKAIKAELTALSRAKETAESPANETA